MIFTKWQNPSCLRTCPGLSYPVRRRRGSANAFHKLGPHRLSRLALCSLETGNFSEPRGFVFTSSDGSPSNDAFEERISFQYKSGIELAGTNSLAHELSGVRCVWRGHVSQSCGPGATQSHISSQSASSLDEIIPTPPGMTEGKGLHVFQRCPDVWCQLFCL